MPETKDEKQVQQQPAPEAGRASRAETFRLVARVWVVLLGISWAGTAAHLLSQVSWLGGASVKVGSIHMSPASLLIGAAVGAAIIFGILKKYGGLMVYARPGLGRAVRLTAYISLASLTAFGAYALYMAPSIASPWWKTMFGPLPIFGKELAVKPMLFPAAGVFFGLMSLVFLLLNREKWADFLIETEGEIKKVSWPARKEYLGSAMIVVLVVAVVSIFLHYVDAGLSALMQRLGVGF